MILMIIVLIGNDFVFGVSCVDEFCVINMYFLIFVLSVLIVINV